MASITTSNNMSQAQKIRWGYLLTEMSLIVIFVYFFFGGLSTTGLITPLLLRITAGILFGAAIFFVFSKTTAQSAMAFPVLAAFGSMLVSTVFAMDPGRSLNETWLNGISFFLFFVLLELMRRGLPGELLIKALLILGAFVMVWSWNPAVEWYLAWLRAAPGSWIPAMNYRLPIPNALAVLLNMFTFSALARLLFEKSLLPRILLIAYSISGFALLYLTSSRGGWLGTAAGLFCLGWIAFYYNRKQWIAFINYVSGERRLLALIIPSSILLLTAISFLIVRQASHSSHPAFFGARGYLWEPAWRAFLEHPITGIGLNNYVNYYVQVHSTPPSLFLLHSHSIYFEVLASGGIIGIAAFSWLLVMLVRALWKQILTATVSDRALCTGAAASATAFLVHGLFDNVHHISTASLFIFMIVLSAGLGNREVVSQSLFKYPAIGLKILGLALAGYAWLYAWQLTPLYDGLLAFHAGELVRGKELMVEAIRRSPDNPVGYQQLGLMSNLQVLQGDDTVKIEAISAMRKATDLDPYWAVHRANLAVVLQRYGMLDDARKEMQKAIEMAPEWYQYYLQLAEMEDQSGDLASASRSYKKALSLWPEWAPMDYWLESPLRSDILVNYSPRGEAAISTLEESFWADTSDYRRLIVLLQAYISEGRWQDAERLVNWGALQTISVTEHKLELLWIEAELAAYHGNYEDAVQIGERVLSQYRTPGVYGPGTDRINYWELTFRRPAIWPEVPPQAMGMEFPSRQLKIADWKTYIQ